MRARIHGVAALFVVGLLVAGCAGTDGAATGTPHRPAPSTTRPARPAGARSGAADPGGMDMGGMAMGGMAMGGMDVGGGHEHDASLPPLTDRLAAATPTQRAATADLLARTKATLAAYASEPAARAAGFEPVDDTKRVVHYRNVANRRDDHELDPTRPEGLVYFHGPAGGLVLLGALYTVRPGEVAPTPGGAIFSWHTHDPRCGTFLVPAGGCPSTFRMLHVWVAPGAADPWIQPIRLAFGQA